MSRSPASTSWLGALRRFLPRLGHRNWIVVADAAYPLQAAPGIQLLTARERLAPMLTKVMRELRRAKHVRPVIYCDAELRHVTDALAPGAERLRGRIEAACREFPTRTLPHEEIIARLDAAGRGFQVLVLKSAELIPYTSVFIELDCGYWSEAAEKTLRRALAAGRDSASG